MRHAPPSKRKKPADPNHALCQVVRIMVAFGRQAGEDDDTIRSRVLAAFKEAIEGEKEWTKQLNFGRGPETTISTAGLFRLVFAEFDLDRKNQWAQEGWLAIIERALGETLGRGKGGRWAGQIDIEEGGQGR